MSEWNPCWQQRVCGGAYPARRECTARAGDSAGSAEPPGDRDKLAGASPSSPGCH